MSAKPSTQVRAYLADIGRRGGMRTGTKGLGALSPERRAEIQAKGRETMRRIREQQRAANGAINNNQSTGEKPSCNKGI